MRHMKNKNYLLVFIVLHITLIVINIVFGYFVFLFDFFAFLFFANVFLAVNLLFLEKNIKNKLLFLLPISIIIWMVIHISMINIKFYKFEHQIKEQNISSITGVIKPHDSYNYVYDSNGYAKLKDNHRYGRVIRETPYIDVVASDVKNKSIRLSLVCGIHSYAPCANFIKFAKKPVKIYFYNQPQGDFIDNVIFEINDGNKSLYLLDKYKTFFLIENSVCIVLIILYLKFNLLLYRTYFNELE